MFSCLPHWRALPPIVQRAVWREYQPGQERTKTASAAYLSVQQYAVAVLAEKDGYSTERDEAIWNSVKYETIVREAGGESPLRGLPRFWEKNA
jgi:hypothetical protein